MGNSAALTDWVPAYAGTLDFLGRFAPKKSYAFQCLILFLETGAIAPVGFGVAQAAIPL